jgi:hypothetical protein
LNINSSQKIENTTATTADQQSQSCLNESVFLETVFAARLDARVCTQKLMPRMYAVSLWIKSVVRSQNFFGTD